MRSTFATPRTASPVISTPRLSRLSTRSSRVDSAPTSDWAAWWVPGGRVRGLGMAATGLRWREAPRGRWLLAGGSVDSRGTRVERVVVIDALLDRLAGESPVGAARP